MAQARALLGELESLLRSLDADGGWGSHTALADLLALYGATRVWFTAERSYKGERPWAVAVFSMLFAVCSGVGGMGGSSSQRQGQRYKGGRPCAWGCSCTQYAVCSGGCGRHGWQLIPLHPFPERNLASKTLFNHQSPNKPSSSPLPPL